LGFTARVIRLSVQGVSRADGECSFTATLKQSTKSLRVVL